MVNPDRNTGQQIESQVDEGLLEDNGKNKYIQEEEKGNSFADG